MSVLANLEPQAVFHYFEEICAIPHGSGNIEAISSYLVEFARQRGLECHQDSLKNVIIIKEATAGREGEEPVMLQGHMDMVAVKKPDSDIDMEKEGLRLAVEGDIIYAEDTSLGGDDGIALAYGLAILDARGLSHPRLEVIFTVDEEVGMDGAAGIDLSCCRGNRMINLDSEEEGIFLAGCAGGMRVDCHLPVERKETAGTLCEIQLGGLQGGHSGAQIHQGRGNANALMGRFLVHAAKQLSGDNQMHITAMEGGLADNAIPRETRLTLVVSDPEELQAAVKDYDAILKTEYHSKDKDVFCRVSVKEEGSFSAVTAEDTAKCGKLIYLLPGGVQAMSGDMEGLVETSLNMGILRLEEKELKLGFSVRSSLDSGKRMLEEKLYTLTSVLGGSCTSAGDYPGWVYRTDSPLRDKMVEVYQEMFGEKPRVEAIHAGLECGFFLQKKPGLDCVSLGPEMKNIHTTEETMSIASVARGYDYLIRVLEEI